MVSKDDTISDSCHGNTNLIVSIPLTKLSGLVGGGPGSSGGPGSLGGPGGPGLAPDPKTGLGLLPASSLKKAGLLKPLDFFLPDELFLTLKLAKLKQVEHLKKRTAFDSVRNNVRRGLSADTTGVEVGGTKAHGTLGGSNSTVGEPRPPCYPPVICECYCRSNKSLHKVNSNYK